MVVHERMSQCKKVKSTEEKKKVKGWSTEEMKNKSREDKEKVIEWKCMSQEEMDQCWKKVAERMEEEVLDNYKVEDSRRDAYRGRGSVLDWRRVRRSKKKYRIRGKNLRLVQGTPLAASAKHE